MTLPVMPYEWEPAQRCLFDVLGADFLRAVGGCVRDALLNLPVKDIDFATTLTPDIVTAKLEAAGITVKPTGLAHGTVTAIIKGRGFEITTLRRDVATDGRRAVVAYTTDWGEDAQRRDFTINALYADDKGIIHDVTGEGLADLGRKRLRFIGNADDRIREDYLRVLRLFRFVAQLPEFTADDAAVAASARQKDGLSHLSAERVTDEWLKLLRSTGAARALRLLESTGIGAVYYLVAEAEARLEKAHGLKAPLSDTLLLALAFNNKPLAFRLPNRVEKGISLLLSLREGGMSFEETAYRHGIQTALDLALWRVIADGVPFTVQGFATLQAYTPPASPVRSEDYIRQGLAGPDLGRALKAAEEAWIRETFTQKP